MAINGGNAIVNGRTLVNARKVKTDKIEIQNRWDVKTKYTRKTEKIIETDSYSNEPVIARAQNGDFLIVYRQASEHVSNDGKLQLIRSTDYGKTWSSPTTVQDDPDYDDRNQVLFVEEETGRVGLLFRKYDAGAGSTVGVFYMYSDDHGKTWTEPTQLTGLNYDTYAYGKPVETSNGLMFVMVGDGDGEVIFSTDNAQTWSDGTSIFSVADSLVEACPIRYTGDKILLYGRNETTKGKFYTKSTDGGLTWDNPTDLDLLSTINGHSLRARRFGNTVLVATWERAPSLHQGYVIEANAGELWQDPELLKHVSFYLFRDAPHKGSNSAGDYGYPSFIKVGADPSDVSPHMV